MEENQETLNNQNATEGTTKKGSPIMVSVIIIAALILAAGVFFALSNNSGKNSKPSNTNQRMADNTAVDNNAVTDVKTVEEEPVMENDSAKVIAVEGGSFYFDPDVITVKKGEKVKIVLSSADAMHDFVIDELGVRTEITPAGSIGEVEFTADADAGEYEFFCSVGNHRANGMVGTLIIEE